MLATFIIGLIIGGYVIHKYHKFQSVKFRLIGIDFTFAKANKKEVTKPVDIQPTLEVAKKTKKSVNKTAVCNFCKDEDIYVGGEKSSKNIMPCPKCKRNKDKVKTKIG